MEYDSTYKHVMFENWKPFPLSEPRGLIWNWRQKMVELMIDLELLSLELFGWVAVNTLAEIELL